MKNNNENPEVDLTLYKRVVQEMDVYSSGEEAIKDHLLMAAAHIHETYEGRDILSLSAGIDVILHKLAIYTEGIDMESIHTKMAQETMVPKKYFGKKEQN